MNFHETKLLINIPRIRETLSIQSYSIDISNEANDRTDAYNIQKIRIIQVVDSTDDNLISFHNQPKIYHPITSILRNNPDQLHISQDGIIFQSFIDTLYQHNNWVLCKVDLAMNGNLQLHTVSEVDGLLYSIGKSKAILMIDYYGNYRNTR